MPPILILTKNLLVDQPLQNDLQQLGYEVFCTTEFLRKIQSSEKNLYLVRPYSVIILSGTLSNQEIQALQSSLTGEPHVILRKFIQPPTVEEKTQLKELNMHDWFDSTSSLDSLREKLSTQLTRMNEEQKKRSSKDYLQNRDRRLKQLDKRLSKKERQLFQFLMTSESAIVSRTELCHCMWKDVPNNSHLSQLSLMVQRIKGKMEACGIEDIEIETLWGRGYKVSSSLDELNELSI